MLATTELPARRYARWMLAILWLVSGGLPLHPDTAQAGLAALQQLGIPMQWQTPLMWAGMLTDLLLAYLTLQTDRRLTWLLELCVVIAYTLLLSVATPALWLHPFGPLLKNLPIVALFYWLFITTEETK